MPEIIGYTAFLFSGPNTASNLLNLLRCKSPTVYQSKTRLLSGIIKSFPPDIPVDDYFAAVFNSTSSVRYKKNTFSFFANAPFLKEVLGITAYRENFVRKSDSSDCRT